MGTKGESTLLLLDKSILKQHQQFNIGQILENISFYGILVLIFLTIIPYGTAETWVKLVFVFIVCIFLSLRIIEGVVSNNSIILNKLFFTPLFGIILLAFWQILSLNLFNFTVPISLNIYATKNFILIFFGLFATLEILLSYTTSESQLRHLIYLVFAISFTSFCFGFLRILFLDGGNHFLSYYFNEKIQFAQFVNRNHFGYLMEMNLGLLLGLQLKAKLVQWQKPIYWVMTALSCFSIIWINSRGAILSMVGLLLFTVFLYFFTKSTDRYPVARARATWKSQYTKPLFASIVLSSVLFISAVFAVSYIGGDPVANRIETISEEVSITNPEKVSRYQIWLATIELIKDNPLWGVGFGAYSTAITKYDKSSGGASLQQAHNDYLEILANGGVVAFGLTVLFIILLIREITKQINSGNSFRQAACFGATIGIFAVMVHSLVDFGLHIIVNALVLIILIVLATAEIKPNEQGLTRD